MALAACLTTGGCVAAGLAGGSLVSAVQLIGDRSVTRTVGAHIDEAWDAVEATLVRMAFRVEGRERTEGEWRLRGVAERVTVEVALERVTPRMTRITLGVETGGILADRHTAATMHEQIAAALAHTGAVATGAPADPTAGEALTSLEAEVRRLRTEMEAQRATTQSSAGFPAAQPAAVRVQPSAVVTVPLSAALPSRPGTPPATSVAQPVGRLAPIVPEPTTVAEPTAEPEPSNAVASGHPAALRPAEALVPIRPVSAPASSK